VWRLEITSAGNYQIYRCERIDSILVDAPGDTDADGFADLIDNCPDHSNPGQFDCDGDGIGDICAAALKMFDTCNTPGLAVPMLPPLGLALLSGGLLLAAATRLTLRPVRRSCQ
jgi:hypothetical protein